MFILHMESITYNIDNLNDMKLAPEYHKLSNEQIDNVKDLKIQGKGSFF